EVEPLVGQVTIDVAGEDFCGKPKLLHVARSGLNGEKVCISHPDLCALHGSGDADDPYSAPDIQDAGAGFNLQVLQQESGAGIDFWASEDTGLGVKGEVSYRCAGGELSPGAGC